MTLDDALVEAFKNGKTVTVCNEAGLLCGAHNPQTCLPILRLAEKQNPTWTFDVTAMTPGEVLAQAMAPSAAKA